MKPPADAGRAARTRRTPQWPPSRRPYPAPRCCRAWSSTPTRPGRGYGRSISIVGTGPRPRAFDLETETLENLNVRTVARSDAYLQVTLMSIPVNGDIGLAKHPDTDQFIRLDRGRAQMGPGKDDPTFDHEVADGWCILVPAGSRHNITGRNTTRRARCTRPRKLPTPTPTTNPPTGLFNPTRSQTSTPELSRRTRPSTITADAARSGASGRRQMPLIRRSVRARHALRGVQTAYA